MKMHSPSSVGAALTGVAVCVLLSPLLVLVVYFIDLPSWESAQEAASSRPSTLMGVAGGGITLVFRALLQTMRLLPRIVACGLTAYLGVCAGYLGLVHVGIIDPDKRLKPR